MPPHRAAGSSHQVWVSSETATSVGAGRSTIADTLQRDLSGSPGWRWQVFQSEQEIFGRDNCLVSRNSTGCNSAPSGPCPSPFSVIVNGVPERSFSDAERKILTEPAPEVPLCDRQRAETGRQPVLPAHDQQRQAARNPAHARPTSMRYAGVTLNRAYLRPKSCGTVRRSSYSRATVPCAG